tara:strand:- start:83 stop:706 length:624 start_codon:yes stop_codon:yes gene_type:complete
VINLIDNEEWKEWSPGYWFSNYGRFASQWTKGKNSHIDHNKWEIKITKPKPDNRKGYRGDYIENAIYPFRTDPIAKHITGGRGHQTTVNPDRVRVTIKRHRAVMDCFKPLDDYSHEIGISKEEWDNTPESSKNFIKRQVYVNHKDHNRSNNHIDNLEWIDVVNNAIEKIKHRKNNNDHYLQDAPHKGKHYSELTREQKRMLGHKVKL